jgi:hypothetical protein
VSKFGKDLPDEKGFPTFQGRRRFMSAKEQAESYPKGAIIVEAEQPEYGWEFCGHMVQPPGTDYPAQSSSDRRYQEFNIPDQKTYFDPIQGLPVRGVIRQVADESDDFNKVGGEGKP